MSEGERIIGVLGGMGPLASADFMARLTLAHPAARDQDHPAAILVSDPRVPDRTAAALDGGPSPLPALLRGIRTLEQAGAGCIAIPCNSAHAWFEPMQAATALPILHIVDAAAAALRAAGIAGGPIGLMGTRATLRLRLYQQLLEGQGYTCLVPDEAAMAAHVTPAIARVKANDIEAARTPLAMVAEALAARGAQAVVLGCTEIPLALRGTALPVPAIDTVDALARAALSWWRG